MPTASTTTPVAAFLIAVAVAGLALPLNDFGKPLSNIALLAGPQALALLALHFLPPRSPAPYLAGASLAVLATLLVFSGWVLRNPPDTFMVVFLYWFVLGSTTACALGIRALLPRFPRVSSLRALLGITTFTLSLAGGALITRFLISI